MEKIKKEKIKKEKIKKEIVSKSLKVVWNVRLGSLFEGLASKYGHKKGTYQELFTQDNLQGFIDNSIQKLASNGYGEDDFKIFFKLYSIWATQFIISVTVAVSEDVYFTNEFVIYTGKPSPDNKKQENELYENMKGFSDNEILGFLLENQDLLI